MHDIRWASGFVFLLVVSARSAPVVYVDQGRGNDRRDGISATVEGYNTGPVRTVQAALRRVSPGGRILVLPTRTPYRESFVVEGDRPLGSARRPLVIDGGGQEWIGWRPVREEWIHRRDEIYRLDRPTKTYTRLFEDRHAIDLLSVDVDRPGIPLAHRQASRWESQLFFAAEGLKNPRDYNLWGTSAEGCVVVHGASHVVLRNFRFLGYRIDAIQLKGICRGIRIESCEIAHSGRGGIFVGPNAEVSIEQVRMNDLGQAGVIADDQARVRMSHVSIDRTPKRLQQGERVELEDDGKDAFDDLLTPPDDPVSRLPDPLPMETDPPSSLPGSRE